MPMTLEANLDIDNNQVCQERFNYVKIMFAKKLGNEDGWKIINAVVNQYSKQQKFEDLK
jgi:hypothetical protein